MSAMMNRHPSPTMVVTSAMSVVSCASVVLTYTVFKRRLGSRKVMALYYFIFLSHLWASSAMVVGVPSSGTASCWFEGVVGAFFSMSAIMWTVSVLVLLYSNVAYKKPVQLTAVHHLLCWCIPLVCVLLPLSTSTYASPSAGIGWCRVVGPDALAWMWVGHYGLCYLCYLATLVIAVRIFLRVNDADATSPANDSVKVNSTQTSDKFRSALWVVLAYPLVYFVCWLPATVMDVLSVVHPDVVLTEEQQDVAAGLACLTGFFSSIVFWFTNEFVRDLWFRVVTGNSFLRTENASSGGRDPSSGQSFLTQRTPGGGNSHRNSNRTKPAASALQIAVRSGSISALPRWFSGSAKTGVTDGATGGDSHGGAVTTCSGPSSAPSVAPSVERPPRHGAAAAAGGASGSFTVRSVDAGDSGEVDPEAGLGSGSDHPHAETCLTPVGAQQNAAPTPAVEC